MGAVGVGRGDALGGTARICCGNWRGGACGSGSGSGSGSDSIGRCRGASICSDLGSDCGSGSGGSRARRSSFAVHSGAQSDPGVVDSRPARAVTLLSSALVSVLIVVVVVAVECAVHADAVAGVGGKCG